MSQGLGRWAETTTKSCSRFTPPPPPGHSSPADSDWTLPWAAKPRGLSRQNPSPKGTSWELQRLVKHRMCSWKHSCLQPGLWAALPRGGGVRGDTNCPNSQKPTQSWTCSPANSTFRRSGEEKLRPKVGLEFLFQNEGFGEGLLSLQHKAKRHIPDWIPFPGRWDLSFPSGTCVLISLSSRTQCFT